MLFIAIDPGVNTGYAEWNSKTKTFEDLKTIKIHEALFEIYWLKQKGIEFKVFMEDARKRKWFGANADAKQQGAGSVKRDCQIIEDACRDWGVEIVLVDPKSLRGLTKLSAEQFKKLTGYSGRTSQHARDAACIIYGR